MLAALSYTPIHRISCAHNTYSHSSVRRVVKRPDTTARPHADSLIVVLSPAAAMSFAKLPDLLGEYW